MARSSPVNTLVTVGGLAVAVAFAYRAGLLETVLAPLRRSGVVQIPPAPSAAVVLPASSQAGATHGATPSNANDAVLHLAPGQSPAAAFKLANAGATAPLTVSAQPSPGAYVIQPGDTLGALAARFGTTVDALARVNGIVNPDHIYAGDTLRLPAA